jgi:hypothetical protein
MRDKLTVLVDEPTPAKREPQPMLRKAARPSLEGFIRTTAGRVIEVETASLSQEISNAYGTMLAALAALPVTSPLYRVQTISFTLAIDSTGTVSLVSAVSGAVKTQTGITFVLTANPAGSDANVSNAAGRV